MEPGLERVTIIHPGLAGAEPELFNDVIRETDRGVLRVFFADLQGTQRVGQRRLPNFENGAASRPFRQRKSGT